MSRAVAAGGLALLTAAGTLSFATTASAETPPTGPGNIEVFPERDMVAVEGYAAQAGQTATVTVKRGAEVIGVGSRVLDATGFMELNHDADGCFDDVTPAIQAGDTVTVSFSGSPLVDSMTVSSARITEITASTPAAGNANSVTLTGTYGPEVNLDRFAVEVVNPAMRDAGAIGERAIGWSPNEVPDPAEPGPTGYTVSGTAANGEFSVTFDDMSQEDQQMVFDGQAVALSWMADRTGVEQQLGLTLAEEGLTGGGAPGCPAGPDGAKPPTSDYTVTWASETEATVTWATAQPVAGAGAVTGYSVAAVDQAANAAGAFRQTGYQTGADATQVVLDGLTAASVYDIQVRSMVSGDMSAPFALAGTVTPGSGGGGTGDTTAPVLTETPTFNGTTAVVSNDRQITLSANEGTIYYTIDGSAVTTEANGNVPSPTAKIYTAPIPIAAETRINVAVIDAAGNAYHESGVVTPRAAVPATQVTGLTILGVTGAGPDAANPQGAVNLGWTAVTDATEYRVRVYDRTDSTATNLATPQYDKIVTGATNGTVTGLPKSAAGHRWVFRVQARTPADGTSWGPLSTGVNAIVPGDTIGVVSAIWRAGDELQIRGSGTNPGATITAHRPNSVGGPGASLGYPAATVGPLEAPDNTGAWAIVVDPAPATNPGDIVLRSSEGHYVKVTVETK